MPNETDERIPVLTKVKIPNASGSFTTYWLKDADARDLISALGDRIDVIESTYATDLELSNAISGEATARGNVDSALATRIEAFEANGEHDVAALESTVSGHTTAISELDDRIDAIEEQEAGWDDKYTQAEIDTKLGLKADVSSVYTKSETYTKTEVNNLISAVKVITYEVVTELPVPGAQYEFNTCKVVYMQKDSTATGQDVYDEFICINEGSVGDPSYIWEKIGSTRIDLSNYYTKTEIDAKLNETGVKLNEDLYTFVNIGKITGASQTNPIKVASEGDDLKDVFNAILGTEVDVNPNITDNSANTMSQSGTGAKGAAEHGATFAAANPTVTFTVANGGVAQYGLKTATKNTYNKKGANTAFVYPIKKLQINGQDYNIRLEVASEYQNIVSVTAGTEVARNGNYIYCLLDANNKVTVKLALPAGSYTQSAQTLCGAIKAYVEYEAASYEEEAVTAFCTYLDADYTQKLTTSAKTSGSSTVCTVPKGTLYPYYGNIASTVAPTGDLIKSNDSACYTNGVDVTMAADGYIWFALPVTKTKIQQYALGSWNDMATTSAGKVSFTLSTGVAYEYNMYRTTAQQGKDSALKVRMN